MLEELHIENFGLMEDVRLTFERGLTVFTGETGAGKSMLIDALGVLLGGRASSELLRHGEKQAKIEGVFQDLAPEYQVRLEEAGYPVEEGQLFLYREINSSGKNLCRIQGRTIPLTLYRTLCEGLVDIHGQIENLSLFNSDTHRDLLDALGNLQDKLRLVKSAAKEYQAINKQERDLTLSESERIHREEILRYQIDEINSINPLPGEEEELNQEKKRLSNSERITSLITEAYSSLYEGSMGVPAAIDLLANSLKALQELGRWDEEASLSEVMESIYYAAEDLANQVRQYKDSLEFEPGKLDQIEERLVQLTKLRKYGLNTDEVLAKRDELQKEFEQIANFQEQLELIQRRKEEALQSYRLLAEELSRQRQEVAVFLEQGLMLELADLGLERSNFKVKFIPLNEPTIDGAESLEFYFSANPGEPPKPLSKVASGGEMSRLMLALKSLLAKVEAVGTFIFDEVDSGVGGRTILKVGEKLAKIAIDKQVFCITHSAHVAALADVHFAIVKEVEGNRTRTKVEILSEKERLKELARMLGGDEVDITYKHAQELYARSRQQR